MEDSSMDIESMGPLRPQTFLFGCELKADKEFQFKVDDEENEHQLSLRTVTLGAGAKDELHIVEAEALDYEGNPTKVVLASLKMSVQPTVSLGGFEITPPVVLRLKCGSGPVYISGQHLVALEEEPESDEEEDDTKIVNASTKRPASGGGAKTPQKKPKLVEDDEDDDEDEDDDDEDEDDLEDDEEEIKAPVKKPVREVAGKNMQKAKQNGKDSKPSTPASKSKTPDSKKDKTLTPKTPKVPLSLEEIKAKMQASVDKGTTLPKLEPKFANYVKNCFRTEDQKVIQALWQWRQSL
ncbi:nucleophosmin [Sylvia borin]